MYLMANDTAHDEHYGRVDDPAGAILSALGDPATLTIDDLAPADEFHLGGAAATSAIIDALKVNASDRVLGWLLCDATAQDDPATLRGLSGTPHIATKHRT